MSINPTCQADLQKYFTSAGTNSAASPVFGNDLPKPEDSANAVINNCLIQQRIPIMFDTVSNNINFFTIQVFRQMLMLQDGTVKPGTGGDFNSAIQNFFIALNFLCLNGDAGVAGVCQNFSTNFCSSFLGLG